MSLLVIFNFLIIFFIFNFTISFLANLEDLARYNIVIEIIIIPPGIGEIKITTKIDLRKIISFKYFIYFL